MWVDIRFGIHVVDTIAENSFVKIAVYYYWNGTRLAGWPEKTALPPALWDPELCLNNALGDLQETDYMYELAKEVYPVGNCRYRLKRGPINIHLRVFMGATR